MKHILFALILILLLNIFSGCAASGAGSTSPQQTTGAPTEAPTTAPTEAPTEEATTAPTEVSPTVSYTIDTAYAYPVRDGVPGWAEMSSKEQQTAIEVPEDIVKNMTTPALLETLYGYPKWQSLHKNVTLDASLTGRKSYTAWAKGHPLLIELLTREDRFDYLYALDPKEFAIRATMSDEDINAADACYEIVQRETYYWIQEVYVYPVTPESPEWATMTEVEKIAACQIPEDILKHLSTDSLWIALYDYPLLADVNMKAGGEEALAKMLATFNGFQEWKSRPREDVLIFSGGSNQEYTKDYRNFVSSFLNKQVQSLNASMT